MMPADSRSLIDTRVLNDRRVTNYYDPGKVVGKWFADHSDAGGGVIWDAYYLYGPEATWTEQPGPLRSSGGPVIESSGDLAAAFSKLG
jgi:hypothetical protein